MRGRQEYNYSIIPELRKKGLLTDELIGLVTRMSFDDLLKLKLETMAMVLGDRLFSFPLYTMMSRIISAASLSEFAIGTAAK